jgi:hypothetical protein
MSKNTIIIKKTSYDITGFKRLKNDINLELTKKSDDTEIDELISLPASKKTKNGYLRDSFVIENNEWICIHCDKIFIKNKKPNIELCRDCKLL